MTVFSLPHHSPRDLPFTPGQTAILFVDMQNAWVIPGRDAHVDPQTHRYFYDRVEASVIPNQQRLLAAMPYAAPLARLGQIRRAGIPALRLGHITEAPPDARGRRRRDRVPLPPGTRCYAVAASLGPAPHSLKARLLGDGLVPLASALGRHRDPARSLDFAPERQVVVYRTGHLELLSSPEVLDLLRGWLR